MLFGFGFTAAACVAAGRLLFGLLGVRLRRGERLVLAFVAGAACVSLLVFALAAMQLARAGVFLASGGVLIAAAALRALREPAAKPLPPLPRVWQWLFAAVYGVFAVYYFVHAMAPEASPDGTAYHLGLVNLYFLHGGLVRLETTLYAYLSQGMEMLYLLAFALGRHSAAALVHGAFLAALPLAMLAYGRRFGMPAAGACAGLLIFAAPIAGVDGTSAYVDVALACTLFAAFYLLRLWEEEGGYGLLVLAGLCAGFAYGLKYTAALAVPYIAGSVVWRERHDWRKAARSAALAGGAGALVMAPWLMRNWLWTGNPFSPFLNRLFPNPYVQIAFEDWLVEFNRHLPGVASRWEVPWQVTVRGGLDGMLGPVFLLAPLALWSLRQPAGGRFLGAAAVFLLPVGFSLSARYLLPCAVFVAFAMAIALGNRPRALAALALVHGVLCWPTVRSLYADPRAWNLSGFPWSAALRLEPEDVYLRREVPNYAVSRLVEERVPPGRRVFAYGGLQQAYTSREIVVEWVSAFNKKLCDALWAPLDRTLEPGWRWRLESSARPLEAVRVVQTAAGPQVWSVSELRVFGGGRELPRLPRWRLRARPNPWDVQAAFDNAVLTRWSSAERMRPGMFVEVDFGAAETVDTVDVVGTRDQDAVRLQLEGRGRGGTWTPLAAAQRSEMPLADPTAMRAAAAAEFKRHRVEYLLIQDGSWGADDFRRYAAEWGLEELGETKGARLYRFR